VFWGKADGYKKTITGPGIGNYVTVGKAMGLARAMFGEDLDINSNRIVVPGFGHPVNLDLDNPYKDMTG
jgi:acetoacetyl-[acyl-carrier protein] synthase